MFRAASPISAMRSLLAQATAKPVRPPRYLLSACPHILLCFDRGGRYRYVSPNVTPLLGVAPSMFIGKTPLETGLPAAQRRQWEEAFLYAQTAKRHLGANAVLVMQGKHGPVRCSARLSVCGERDRTVACNARIDSGNSEESISNEALLAFVGHELRAPLNAIRAAVGILTAPSAAESNRRQAISVLQRQSAQAERLIENLFDLARAAAHTLQVEMLPVPLRTLAKQAVESLQELHVHEQHSLRVQIDNGITVCTDGARLQQILVNLISNAIKYTDSGGEIEISAAEEDDGVVLRVRDNGCGIPPQVLPRIFDLFVRGDHPQHQRRDGLGVGLHVAKKLAEAIGANISVHSPGVGRGSEFRIHLPRAVDRENAATG